MLVSYMPLARFQGVKCGVARPHTCSKPCPESRVLVLDTVPHRVCSRVVRATPCSTTTARHLFITAAAARALAGAMAPPARVLVVAGPTAVGKSSAALRLCEARDGELVSADSVQLYRGLDVGSNKPSPAELQRVRHHLVDVADASKPWSAGAWCDAAAEAIGDVARRGKLPVVVGGTMMYAQWLVRGAPDAPKRGCESLHLGDMDARGIAIGNSCVHYVTIGTYTDLHTHTADRARKIVEDAFAQADEVHINIGLHYPLHYEVGQVDGYKEDVAQVFEIMQRSAVEGKRAIWWETAAQHFPAEDGSGMYEGWEKADAKGRCFCMPVSDRSPRHTNTRTLLASGNFPDLRVMPYFSLTLPRFDLHHEVFCTNERTLQCCDCTHFCYTIPHWEHVFATLRDVIETEEHTARALASQLGAQARGE